MWCVREAVDRDLGGLMDLRDNILEGWKDEGLGWEMTRVMGVSAGSVKGA